MTKSLPIDKFENPENIMKLQELIGFDALFEVIGVIFGQGEWAKPGCFINAKWVRDIDDVQQCKQDLSEVLTEEGIPHDYPNSDESPMVFIGNLDLLPEQSDDFFTRCPNDLTDDEGIALGRFIGVPDADNAYIDETENGYDPVTYPKEVLDLTDNQVFYLRLLSWHAAPTEDGVERGVNCGQAMNDALNQAIEVHPEYETELRICLHTFMTSNSPKFYGKLSPKYAEHLHQKFTQLLEKAYEKHDEETLQIDKNFVEPRFY